MKFEWYRSGMRSVVSSLLVVLCAGVFGMAATSGETAATSKINFVAKNAIATANGEFHKFQITEHHVALDALGESFVVVEVEVASLDTDNKDRDDHLRTADFFEVERWPLAKVRVHSAERIEGVRYRAKFDVSIRDAQKTIDGEFEIVSEDPLSVKGSLVIDRMDFGIGTPKTWNPMSITNEVPVTFEASFAP